MSLKNLMEDKQLNFTRPLLSVRRLPPTTKSSEAKDKGHVDNSVPKIPPLPVYKSDLKSGPVGHPGSVPFQWERTPGKPKDENNPQVCVPEGHSIVPKLPPGWTKNDKQYASDKYSKSPPVAQNQTGNMFSIPSLDVTSNKNENSNDALEDNRRSSSEDDDETYMDARDTLSRTESFFVNCSVSGLSGLDGPYVKPTGTFSTDPQTRDFMMGRFLPAAKAMASETPQYASTWKQPGAQQQPSQVKKLNVDKMRLFYQHIPHDLYARDNGVEENEYSDSDSVEPENSSIKVCGLIPRFCLKNSFLNPVPGMRMQTRVPISLARSVRTKSSYSGSGIRCENEHAILGVSGQRHIDELQTLELHHDKVELNSDSNGIHHGRNYHDPDISSLYKRLQGNSILPNQNELCRPLHPEEKMHTEMPDSAKSSKEDYFDFQRKGCQNFRELLDSDSTISKPDSGSPVVEKTVYVDSVQMVNSSSSDKQGLTDQKGDGINIIVKQREQKEVPLVSCSPQDIKKSNAVYEKAISQPKIIDSMMSSFLYLPDRSNQDGQLDVMTDFRQDLNLFQGHNTLTSTKMASDGNIELDNQFEAKSHIHESYNSSKLQLPLPPPLPQSPSDSWLSRALPTISSRNKPSWSSHGAQNYVKVQAFKIQSPDPHWETIVKTSNAHHGHSQFSQERLTPIPEA